MFAELGFIGLAILFALLRAVWKKFTLSEQSGMSRGVWENTGKAAMLCVLYMSVTQHSFGAPIYGMTLMFLIGIAYSQCRR